MKIIITGAFSYSGRYIAQRLLDAGHSVATLTHRRGGPDDLFGGRVATLPLQFAQPDELVRSLEGADALINTYWTRFGLPPLTFEVAEQNSCTLFAAAKKAGVRRIVHISVTNAAADAPFPYYRAKARVEAALSESGVSYTVLRPTIIYGGLDDILINNIAWALRRLPVFGVFGGSRCKIQPVFVEDLAALAVEQFGHTENTVINAVGPETFTFRELVAAVAHALGVRRLLLPVPEFAGMFAGWVIGKLQNDIFLLPDEIRMMRAGLLHVTTPPTGPTRLTSWMHEHASELGRAYAPSRATR
ncbi:MAG: NAD(P)H-binding protein [Kiritimatiellaeota bacterium]|nr:NAD(P)H-binding protein [Kiritimatiellota bacterium]